MVSVNTHRLWEEKQLLERGRNDEEKIRPDLLVCRRGPVVSGPIGNDRPDDPATSDLPKPWFSQFTPRHADDRSGHEQQEARDLPL